jgi:hypothetical protein
MKRNRDLTSMLATLLLATAVIVALLAIGCFGGGEQGTGATGTTGLSDAPVDSVASSSTVVAMLDPLSSFKSKDPFIPQAQVTTTSAPPVTTIRTTTTRATTVTTVPHKLQVTALPAGGATVSFTLDGNNLTGFGAGPALFTGPWGSIQIVSINGTTAPFTATFRRNGSISFTLQSGQSKTW